MIIILFCPLPCSGLVGQFVGCGDQVISQLSDFTGAQFPHCNGISSAQSASNTRLEIFTKEERRADSGVIITVRI